MLAAFMVGRILLGGFFVMSAYEIFSQLGRLGHMVAARGVPFAEAAVAVAGILLVVGGLSFLLGLLPRVGVAAIVLFLVPVTLIMHAFWADRDAATRMNDIVNFSKNVALLGATLMCLAIPEPWPLSVHPRSAARVRLPA